MLKKLKIKFILHNILLLSLVVAIISVSLFIFTYFREETKITRALESNVMEAMSALPQIDETESRKENLAYEVSFTVLINSSNHIISQTSTEMDIKLIREMIEAVVEAGLERGVLSMEPSNVSFMKTQTRMGTLISFVSRENLEERMNETVWQSILGGFISLLLFFYINLRIANMAIAPIEDAWNQQKQFIADASHDLKTPLTVILANNNIISAHQDETVASQMKWIESTSEEATRMSDLINKMLELAKGEAAREDLRLGEINISELVENSILQFEVVAFEKNITIESGIQADIFALTHSSTLSKILEILFDNAIKYSEEGGKITVILYKASKKIYLSVNNKGEYIKPDELPHVFERFYRSNKERTVGGHGLGLSLAKKKCDLLGHKISVESNPDDGTTFTVIIKSRK